MDNLKFIFRLYFSPQSAMSEIMDSGSWLFTAAIVVIVAFGFFATINSKLETAYHVPTFNEFFQPSYDDTEVPALAEARYAQGMSEFNAATANQRTIPILGDRFYSFFSFEPGKFYQPLLVISIFYVPAAILLMSLFGAIGSFGLVLRRDYGTLAVCSLNTWAAAHMPFAIAGIVLHSQTVNPLVYLSLWAASGLLFGVLMIFALRTVFGANYGVAILVVSVAWLSMSLAAFIFLFVSPVMFSPFLIFYAVIYFGGFLGGEVRGFGNASDKSKILNAFCITLL